MTNKCTFEKLFINVPFIFLHHAANVVFFISLRPLGTKLLLIVSKPPPSSAMRIQSLRSLRFVLNTSKPVCTLLYTTAQRSADSCSGLLLDLKQPRMRMCFSNTRRYEMHISQQRYQVLLQLSKSPNELRLPVIDFENITVNYFLSACLKRYG